MNDEVSRELAIDPRTGRVPSAVAQVMFRGDGLIAICDPGIVAALDAASENTRRAWSNDWEVFRAWLMGPAASRFDEVSRMRLPVMPHVLACFVDDMARGYGDTPARAIATVRRYLATIGTLHRLLRLEDPCNDPIVRNVLKGCARGSLEQGQAAPVHWSDIKAAFDVLPSTLPGLRDKALLAVGHNSMARRAELVALDVADIEFRETYALAMLKPTKGRLESKDDPRYLGLRTMALVREWLDASGLTEGALFTAVHPTGGARCSNGVKGKARRLLNHGRRLHDSEVNLVVKRAMALIAEANGDLVLPVDAKQRKAAILRYAKAYSGHSMRVGAAQDLVALGMSTDLVLQSGGWSDSRMIKRYLRKLDASNGGMAQYLSASEDGVE
jgi:site-specific recombinase XerD